MTNETNIREIILDILTEILEKGNYSHLVLSRALDKYRYLERQDRALITRVTEGTVEYLIRLDAVIDRYSKVKVKKMKPAVRTILRMSVYQILYLDRVPDSAICNEAVKLAKKRRLEGLSGFVNGVLRTIAREKDSITFSGAEEKYLLPQWILSMWEKEYGTETAQQTALAFLEQRPLSVRMNLSLCSKEDILESLKAQGIKASPAPGTENILFLENYDSPDLTEAFCRGWITVQDLSSSLVGRIASPEKGCMVMDVCSAPGGKTLDMADRLSGTGLVEARDLTEYKIALVEQNVARCGFDNVTARVMDARKEDPSMWEKADIVLADLPCSGLGIIGKKPDIRFRIRKEDLEQLAALQREILSVVWKYVKPGGKLIYSTCTIDRLENEENAEWILENLPFRPLPLETLVPGEMKKDCRNNQIQLLPGRHPCDGFFIAAFERIRQE